MKWNEASSFCCSKYQQRHIEMSEVFRSWPHFKDFWSGQGRATTTNQLSFTRAGRWENDPSKLTTLQQQQWKSNEEQHTGLWREFSFESQLARGRRHVRLQLLLPGLTVSKKKKNDWLGVCVLVCLCVSSLHRNLQNKAWVGRLSWSQLKQL